MAFLLFYPDDAFRRGLPDEVGTRAEVRGAIRLKLEDDGQPVRIEIKDNEGILNEIDGAQVLATDVTIAGVDYLAGTPVHAAYDLINAGTGHKVTALHFGGDGSQQGAVQGVVSSEDLKPGERYSFDQNRSSWKQGNCYRDYVACFVSGTRIDTPAGPRAVERLREGDLVLTRGGKAVPVRWTGSRRVIGHASFAPIEFARGVLGNERVLRLSPQHRVVRSGACLQVLFDAPEVLVAAKHLVNGETVRAVPYAEVRYWHLLLDGHQIIRAEGAEVETLLAGPLAAAGFGLPAQLDLAARYPARFGPNAAAEMPALPCLTGSEAALLPPLRRDRRARMQTWAAAA